MNGVVAWLRRLWRYQGAAGPIWRARDRLAALLAMAPPEIGLAYGDLVPRFDDLLAEQLPQVLAEGRFLRRYLATIDLRALRAEVDQWERRVWQADEAALRAVRQRNLALARSQLDRILRLTAALHRSEDQLAGLALAIEETTGRIAAAGLEGPGQLEPELQRLRDDLESLAGELAEIHAGL